MQNKNGFTLIELMIVIVIVGILATIVIGAVSSKDHGGSMGMNGYVESRCIDGYKFIVGSNGEPRQVLSEFGKGVPCESRAATPGK